MHGHNLIGVYQSQVDAERVRDKLISEGFPANDIRLSRSLATQTARVSDKEEPGFWAWLFGEVPEEEREWYGSQVRENRAAVSVRVVNEQRHRRALDIMEEFQPIDLGDQGMGSAGLHTGATGMQAQPAVPPRPGKEGEQVIPVVKEELSVGKRATERHYRVKTYVIEKPVEEQVTLRDERVEIEHRPVSGATARDTTMPQQREIDVVERHEEPVVEKRGRATEEVVVRKEVTERPETVRGTVRETKVDVDKEPANTALGPATSPKPPRQ